MKNYIKIVGFFISIQVVKVFIRWMRGENIDEWDGMVNFSTLTQSDYFRFLAYFFLIISISLIWQIL